MKEKFNNFVTNGKGLLTMGFVGFLGFIFGIMSFRTGYYTRVLEESGDET